MAAYGGKLHPCQAHKPMDMRESCHGLRKVFWVAIGCVAPLCRESPHNLAKLTAWWWPCDRVGTVVMAWQVVGHCLLWPAHVVVCCGILAWSCSWPSWWIMGGLLMYKIGLDCLNVCHAGFMWEKHGSAVVCTNQGWVLGNLIGLTGWFAWPMMGYNMCTDSARVEQVAATWSSSYQAVTKQRCW